MLNKTGIVVAFLLGFLLTMPCSFAQQSPQGLAAEGAKVAVTDAFTLPLPSKVQLGGLLGARFIGSEQNRLLKVNEDELLDGFRHRPGTHPWIGEHVGKWLHAASLTYGCTGDAALREKLDRVATELMKTQEADGYLGTYSPDKRFGLFLGADWDVWSHKYGLIGLLAYYQYTGNKDALETCKRVGDLLINTFSPGKKDILSAGTHMGMAATSVLEPMVLLYRATGDKRYLTFAEHLVYAWDQEKGPHVLPALLARNPVYRVANAKAYEMLSNLAGLCELYRVTGKEKYIEAVLNAWKDITANRLYVTGSGSSHEHWQADFHLPNGEGAQICETCVTVTWMQLNIELLRLLGQARFGDELEKTLYNHLLGAQKPTCDDWAYYTPLEGHKPYDASTNCCHSSGPRGVALIPSFVYSTTQDGITVNIFSASKATLPLKSGGEVTLEQRTQYPLDGKVEIVVTPTGTTEAFSIRLRPPVWSPRVSVSVNQETVEASKDTSGFLAINRTWNPGDTISCTIDMAPRIALGDHENDGRMAVFFGPLVLTLDRACNAATGVTPLNAAPAVDDPAAFKMALTTSPDAPDAPLFETEGLAFNAPADAGSDAPVKPAPCKIVLTPFYAAGANDASRFCVWMKRPATITSTSTSRFLGATETRSRKGNVDASICDGEPTSFVVTFDGTKQDEDWYALARQQPVSIKRIVFTQGRLFHDGGWFDASKGKPRVQVQKTQDGPWEDAATIEAYPATTATDSAGLTEFQEFAVDIAPVSAVGIRVIGAPACGDSPAQAFSSCAELSAL